MRRLCPSKAFSAQVPAAEFVKLNLVDLDQVVSDSFHAAGDRQKLRGKTVLVAGATGGVGKQVVQTLLNEGVKVRALVRDYTKAVGYYQN